MTPSLPRHGRFLYQTETLIKSQYSAQHSQPKSDVKNEDISNTWLKIEGKNLHFSENFGQIFNFKKKILLMNSSGS